MAISDRKKREKNQRRQSIIAAAEKLFFTKGYETVSLNDIAKELHLGRSTLYLYFENKEELLFAIVLRGALILHKMVHDEVKNAGTAFEKLDSFRKAYYDFAQEYPDYLKYYNYLFSGRFDLDSINQTEYKIESIAQSKYYEEYKKLLEGNLGPNFPIPKFSAGEYLDKIVILRSELLNILCNALEQGKSEGTVRSDVNSAEATVLLTLIANSIDNLPPDLKLLLEKQQIGHEQFLMDVGQFIGYMVSNRKK
ncbi:TetR/AcrR family transcriptional regulator [Methanobacterium alcaliphilum]|uniref:TetR/AcrR family transcriptional regulator n=1 Tax=Methanobacterium alcaliphilum TaxID=392018 RepID=UPI00200A7CBB|nr:TetR/AcrR family transcriptional regulator [Methanobacterium alcaliphilum]MCK9150830.1 TetR/AcrR family transcriptional regulator [Methanobacterium alcaliphilum]